MSNDDHDHDHSDESPTGDAEQPNSGESPEAGDNPAAERAGINAEPSEEEKKEIEEERERRLDPDNRPENAEVDNSDAELPTVEAFDKESGGDVEGSVGTSDPGAKFREMEISEEEKKEMAEERERRLDPDNRPENAEVDNTGKEMEDGRFVDDD